MSKLARVALGAAARCPAAPSGETFSLHVGGDLQLPTRVRAAAAAAPAAAAAAPKERDFFDGVPLRAWAEALGERVMPAYEAVKEEGKAAKASAVRGAAPPPKMQAPAVPHFLPFTRWAAQSKVIQDTFIVDEKNKKKARLSWYHPDDTMVPRDWFRGGLLKDLAYYKPFSSSS